MSYETTLGYTDEGQLLGHLAIAIEMLDAKIADVVRLTGEPFPKELALRLKHMILSHHGTYEFGSPSLPMTPEAIALHHLDNLDAKVHEFARSIQDDPNSGLELDPLFAAARSQALQGRVERVQEIGSSVRLDPSTCQTSNDEFSTCSPNRVSSRCGPPPWPDV